MGKDPVTSTDEHTITLINSEEYKGEFVEPVRVDAVNTGREIEQESAGMQLVDTVCGQCGHRIDPSRRGASRCSNGCMCTSMGCTPKVTETANTLPLPPLVQFEEQPIEVLEPPRESGETGSSTVN